VGAQVELATRLAEDNAYCGVVQSDEEAVKWWQGALLCSPIQKEGVVV